MAIVINGSGTVTGLAVGGLPDGTVDAGTLAANSVDSAELIDGAVDDSHMAAMAASKLTGTVADARISALTASKLTGTVAAARMPTGSVLQVVSSIAQAYGSTNSSSFVDTGTETAITPSSSSSKILCLYHTGICYQTTADANFYVNYTLLRGSTNLGHSTGGISGTYIHSGSFNDYGYNISFNYLDSPSTTSAVTYKTQYRATTGTIYNDLEGRSSLILMEIAG